MLSRRIGPWTRVLVDVEDYRGRRERQLRDLAARAAERVVETGKMLQLEPMPALERRWIHLALRDNDDVATQSIGEEPNRRVVVLPRNPRHRREPGTGRDRRRGNRRTSGGRRAHALARCSPAAPRPVHCYDPANPERDSR